MAVRRIDHSIIRALELAASRKFDYDVVGSNAGRPRLSKLPALPRHVGAPPQQADVAAPRTATT